MTARQRIKLVDTTQNVTPGVAIDQKCRKCTRSICCNSINQKVPTPRSMADFDHLLWQVSHENINVFKDSDGWFLHIYTRCDHLLPGGVCGIYERRPFVCRAYDNDYCEFDVSIAEAAELFFSTYAEFDDYCRRRFKHWDQRFKNHGAA